MISPTVMLAPYGLAGELTGICYRSATEYVTRKLTEEWYNIIILLNVVAIIKPTNCDRSCAVSAKSWSWS